MKYDVKLGDKVELTALQLIYLLDDALETLILREEDGQEVDAEVSRLNAEYGKEQNNRSPQRMQ